MTELIAAAAQMSASRPVLKLRLGRTDGVFADVNDPIYSSRPYPKKDDVIYNLIVQNYAEQFNMSTLQFEVDKNAIAMRAMNDIRNSVCLFLDRNLGMKSPRQSNVYKWAYRSMPTTVEFEDVLVMVYKYLRTFCDYHMYAEQNSEKHVKNAIAIFEALQEKYDK